MYGQTELDRLVEAMRANGVTTLEVKSEGEVLRLVLPTAPVAQSAMPATPAARREAARSPGIGTFLPRGMDDGLPPLPTGAAVTEGEVLGYLCQGAARLPITAPAAGALSGDAPEEGILLGYGDTVFIVEAPT